MIQKNTILKVLDNSGINSVKCIQLFTHEKAGKIGHPFTGVVTGVPRVLKSNFRKDLNKNAKKRFIKGDIVKGLIVSTAKEFPHNSNLNTGIKIKILNKNGAIIIKNDRQEPIAARMKGVIPYDLRKNGKLISLSTRIIL